MTADAFLVVMLRLQRKSVSENKQGIISAVVISHSSGASYCSQTQQILKLNVSIAEIWYGLLVTGTEFFGQCQCPNCS